MAIALAIGRIPIAADRDVSHALVLTNVIPMLGAALGAWILTSVMVVVVDWSGVQRQWIAAVLGGLPVIVAVFSYAVWDFQNSRGQLAAAVRYTEGTLERVVVDAMRDREMSGRFHIATPRFGPTTIETRRLSEEHVQYIARTRGVPGLMIADLGTMGGELRWEQISDQSRRGEFLVGTIVGVQDRGVTVKDSAGVARNVSMAAREIAPAAGTRVVVTLDRSGRQAQFIDALQRR
jgi:hypothetical protein